MPEMKFGDNAELFLTGTASIGYDDNIFLSSGSKTGDTIFNFAPGIDLPFGTSSTLSGDFLARVDFLEYAEHSAEDAILPDIRFSSKYDAGKTKFNVTASYQDVAQNNATIRLNGLVVQTDLTNIFVYGESGLTEKTSVGVGVKYNDTTYNQPQFDDSSTWSVPVDIYYGFSPKTSVSMGYRYSDSTVSGNGVDNSDNFFNVGARGEFTPLLTGQFRIGYDELEYAHGGSKSSQLGVDSTFVYTYSPKTTYTLGINNFFANSGIGVVTRDLNVAISGTTAVTNEWSVTPTIGYSHVAYPGTPERIDNVWQVQVALSYAINAYSTVTMAVAANDDNSNLPGVSFNEARATLGVHLRF